MYWFALVLTTFLSFLSRQRELRQVCVWGGRWGVDRRVGTTPEQPEA